MPSAHQQTVDEVLTAYRTSAVGGLTGADARARLERDGPNRLAAERAGTWLAEIPRAVYRPARRPPARGDRDLGAPLGVRARVAAALRGDGDHRRRAAERTSWATCRSSAPRRRSPRCGRCPRRTRTSFGTASVAAIPAADVVPGDILVIEEGDTIAADGRVVESTALQTAEAALTGESLPVAKQVAPIAGDAALGDRLNMIFSGTAATYGRGRAVVVATGMRTEMGRIAGTARARAGRAHAAAEGARSRRPAARRRRRDHRGRDDRDHRPRGGRARDCRRFSTS